MHENFRFFEPYNSAHSLKTPIFDRSHAHTHSNSICEFRCFDLRFHSSKEGTPSPTVFQASMSFTLCAINCEMRVGIPNEAQRLRHRAVRGQLGQSQQLDSSCWSCPSKLLRPEYHSPWKSLSRLDTDRVEFMMWARPKQQRYERISSSGLVKVHAVCQMGHGHFRCR